MSKLTENGYVNLIKVMRDYYKIKATPEFIDTYVTEFENAFYEPSDFYEEANSGGISDTFPRDIIGDVLAKVIAGMDHWPLYMDKREYTEEFMIKYDAGLERLELDI